MKRFSYPIIAICCLLFVCIKAHSQKWISLDGSLQRETMSCEVLESNASIYKLKVNIHGLYDNIINNEKGVFHILNFDEGNNLSFTGNPALPCFTQILAIPPGADLSATVIEEKWKDVEMGLIYPAQPPVYEERFSKGFIINGDAYNSVFKPDMVKIGEEHSLHGIRSVGMSICPFKYYPQENRLSVLCDLILVVSFQNENEIELQEDSENNSMYSNTVYRQRTSTSDQESNVRNNDDYDYLIITENTSLINNTTFQNNMKNFRMWKALKGLKTKVVSTSVTGTYQEDIRDYIIQERSKGVKYVLLVGDDDYLPLSYVYSFSGQGNLVYGDFWYGCDVDSVTAAIPVGRFSISSVLDFSNMVKKTIKYEHEYYSHGNCLLVAHMQGAPHTLSYQGVSNSIKNFSYTNSIPFTTAYGAATGYDQGDGASNAYVISRINYGDHIINYRGHGGDTYWGTGWNIYDESFDANQISNMDSNTCCLFFSVACNTGNIAYSSDCMLETFTRSDHGAAAFIGATMPSQTEANDFYDKYLFKKLLNQNVYNLGYLNINAQNENILTYAIGTGNEYMAKDNAHAYLCGGDPSLEIWTDTPSNVFDVNVTSSNGYITVSSSLTDNYYIAVVSEDGDLIDRIDCSSSTCTFPKPVGNFYFAINKHNYWPYVVYYDTESEYIQNVTFNYDAYYENNPISIGDGVTPDIPDGDVVVKSGRKLIIKNGTDGVYIDACFECEKGAIFEVQ